MRRISRIPLDANAQDGLRRKQTALNKKAESGAKVDATSEWNKARRSKPVQMVLSSLKNMAGDRERCMYCEDSHGTDIEHFWPKAPYPEHMFQWPNLLLCCTECGRFKGGRFPLNNGEPLLIDPTADDPWRYLEFDPATGAIVPRYDKALEAFSPKGDATVQILQLDRREALGAGYRKTFRRLAKAVQDALDGAASFDDLPEILRHADDHSLLRWCFSDAGRMVAPFNQLSAKHPDVWAACAKSVR